MIEKMAVRMSAGTHERDLDRPGDAALARAVEPRRLVDLRGDRQQRRVDDEHVVADEDPGDDVRDRPEHEVRAEEVDVARSAAVNGERFGE